MPKILNIFGCRVVIYPNDHQPSHVHVIGKDGEAVFNLNCPHGPAGLRASFNFSGKELRKIEAELIKHIPLLCQHWREIHGAY